VLQSKLLCLSLLYLLTTLPPALYVSFTDPGRRGCIRLLPFPSPPKPLFRYPPGYGEHRHALPTPRALCSNPVAFAGQVRPARVALRTVCTRLPVAVWPGDLRSLVACVTHLLPFPFRR
jgi:hypothetical protein